MSRLRAPATVTLGGRYPPDTYYQAGALSRAFHGQAERTDSDWDAAAVAKSIDWLDKPHRIKPDHAARLRTTLLGHRMIAEALELFEE